jgi:hypothetical protein
MALWRAARRMPPEIRMRISAENAKRSARIESASG